jgi:shikimate kinase
MMGVGKSTVGRALASELGRPIFDSDEMIEERTGRTVREIWITDGEPAFRALETEVLLDALASPDPSVIAAAGGVVLSEANRQALRGPDAHVVWLCCEVDVLVDRVRSGGHRPLLDDDPEAALRRLYDERAPLYQEVADAIVSVDNRSVGDVTRAVLRCCG